MKLELLRTLLEKKIDQIVDAVYDKDTIVVEKVEVHVTLNISESVANRILDGARND